MEGLDQGLSVRGPQVEQLRDEKERVGWVEKVKMYVWVGAESTVRGSGSDCRGCGRLERC